MHVNESKDYIDHLKTAVIIIDKDYHVLHLNSAAEIFLRLSEKRARKYNFKDFFIKPEQLIHIIEQSIEKNSSYTKRQITTTLHDLDQTTFDFSVSPSDYIVVIEIHILDRFLRISSEENIYQSQESTKSLVRGLAHEIKNPLAGIQGAAQLLDRKIHDTSIQEYTQIIIAETKRLSGLVDRLLLPAREVKYSEINIHEVTERVYQLLHAEISQNENLHVVLHKDYDPSIPSLTGDKGQLIQAALNISRNALEALAKQQGNIYFSTRILRTFTIGNKYHKLVCELEIVDDGPGIPEKLRDTLFMPMVTGRDNGSGLGLSIAQSIINRHQGIINFSSSAGRTSFKIHLPILEN